MYSTAKRFPTFQHLVQVQDRYSTVQEGIVQYSTVHIYCTHMYSTAKRFPTFQHLVQVQEGIVQYSTVHMYSTGIVQYCTHVQYSQGAPHLLASCAGTGHV